MLLSRQRVALGIVFALVAGSSAPAQTFKSQGYVCNLDPNAIDRPGVIFYQSGGGRLMAYDISSQLQLVTSPLPNTVETSLGKMSARVAAEIANINSSGIDANIIAAGSVKREVKIVLKNRSLISSDYSAVVGALAKLSSSQIPDGKTFYIIRSVQQAKDLDIKLNKGFAADLGGEAKLKSAFSVAGNVSGDATTEFLIQQTFAAPLTTCILAEKLKLKKRNGLPLMDQFSSMQGGTKGVWAPSGPSENYELTGSIWKGK
jgi:hypothetical protein